MNQTAHNLPTMKVFWLSSEKMTVRVGTDGLNYINEAAPIVSKFIGQPLKNLERWMTRQGGFRMEQLR